MKKNWLLEHHFVRGDYEYCKQIIQNVKETGNSQEYPTYIKVLAVSESAHSFNDQISKFIIKQKIGTNSVRRRKIARRIESVPTVLHTKPEQSRLFAAHCEVLVSSFLIV